MPDLNREVGIVVKDSAEIKIRLSRLLEKYENLYREGNRQFLLERTASSGSMAGLEEFRRIVLFIKRNKDVIASLMRGINNLKPLSNFKFIEEEVPTPKLRKKKKAIPKLVVDQPEVVEES